MSAKPFNIDRVRDKANCMEERLQKVLASAGIASRRKAEAMIVAGRVQVNGQPVTALGTKVDPEKDTIRFDGKPLTKPEIVVYLVHKPKNVVTTADDPAKRRRVIDLVPASPRVFPVGRLDRTTEGLILLTNDGELALHLSHPRYEHTKEYQVTGVTRRPVADLIQQIQKGINLDGDLVVPDAVIFGGVRDNRLTLSIVVHEGRKHLIKRLCSRVGFEVTRLIRLRVGSLTLEGLRPGQSRRLNRQELRELQTETKIHKPGLPPDPANHSVDQ
jgi:pseudouridine synthase